MAKLSELSKALKMYDKATIKEIKEIVADNGSNLQTRAIRTLNGYSGNQLESLNFINIVGQSKDNGLSFTVGVPSVSTDKKSHLPAYVEFGTGLSAKSILALYPEEVKQIAMQFFVNGRGTLIGHPYLFNNYQIVVTEFTKELNTFLKK